MKLIKRTNILLYVIQEILKVLRNMYKEIGQNQKIDQSEDV